MSIIVFKIKQPISVSFINKSAAQPWCAWGVPVATQWTLATVLASWKYITATQSNTAERKLPSSWTNVRCAFSHYMVINRKTF